MRLNSPWEMLGYGLSAGTAVPFMEISRFIPELENREKSSGETVSYQNEKDLKIRMRIFHRT